MKCVILIFFVFFYGCSLFSQFEQQKIIDKQTSPTPEIPVQTPMPVSDLLPTKAKIENLSLSLDDCKLTLVNGKNSESFDFGFKGICGFEKNPDEIVKPRIVKTKNGNVLAVINVEKIENHTSIDKHSQPCNLKIRFVIVRKDKIFLSNQIVEKQNRCLTQLDEKDYFIFSKDPVILEQAEKDKKIVN